jgi:uncharacterized protein (UPF0276 family)
VGRPIPVRAGIGLRTPHHDELLAERPGVAWLEVHSENYFAAGGTQCHTLEAIRNHYPLSLHGVGLSLGSTDPLNREHLRQLRRLNDAYQPALLSEHLSWGSVNGIYANDLLPLPYTEEALAHIAARIDEVQDYLGRQILIENVSSYLEYRCSTLTEWEFLAALVAESRCGLLLDINNLYVSAHNQGFAAIEFLDQIPCAAVSELHLAGHSRVTMNGRDVLIDTHSTAVCEAVWKLYQAALCRLGPVPTLIEWDADLPPLSRLLAEAQRADRMMEGSRARAA